jgi:hypothetical protein
MPTPFSYIKQTLYTSPIQNRQQAFSSLKQDLANNKTAEPLKTQNEHQQRAEVISVTTLTQKQIQQLPPHITAALPKASLNGPLYIAQLKIQPSQTTQSTDAPNNPTTDKASTIYVVTHLPLSTKQSIQIKSLGLPQQEHMPKGVLTLLSPSTSIDQQVAQQLGLYLPHAKSSSQHIQALINILQQPLPSDLKQALTTALNLPNFEQLSNLKTLIPYFMKQSTSVESLIQRQWVNSNIDSINPANINRSSDSISMPASVQNKSVSVLLSQLFQLATKSSLNTTTSQTAVITPTTSTSTSTPTTTSDAAKNTNALLMSQLKPQLAQALTKALQHLAPTLTQSTSNQISTPSTMNAQTTQASDTAHSSTLQPVLSKNVYNAQIPPLLNQSAMDQIPKPIENIAQLLLNHAQISPVGRVALAAPHLLLTQLLQQLQRPLTKINSPNQSSTVSNPQLENNAIQQLIKLLSQSFASINTQQLNNLLSRQTAEHGVTQWQMDLPYIDQQQAGAIALQIQRKESQENSENKTEHKQHQWRLTLEFDIAPIGCFYALIKHEALQKKNEEKPTESNTSITFMSENPSSLNIMQTKLEWLKERLEGIGICVSVLNCKRGRPTKTDLQYSHHLVDVRT